jgi:preprotein translocase subunit SecA
MVNSLLKLIFGTKHERDIKKLKPIVEKVNSYEEEVRKMKADEFVAFTRKYQEMLKGKDYEEQEEIMWEILPKAFALVREAGRRTIGLRHFDVQVMGAIVLHQGKIAEMKTGEGKTLVATMPLYLRALTKRGVHLVTVNDYLARRDADWMGPIYRYLGLTVGVIQHNMDYTERQSAYASDVVYGTNNEFGFDYLRDNMVEHKSLRVQRELYYAIIDEVDSILIDEARTPLIISGPAEESTEQYYKVNKIIPRLEKDVDFEVDEKAKTVTLTDAGVKKVEKLLGIKNLYDPKNVELIHVIVQCLRAHVLFKRDVDYIVKDGEVVIVDEFTGRLMPGRRYSDGLHQALEAKEGLTVRQENQTLATITFQNFFKLYYRIAGMTGTADTEAEEFKKIYNLDVVVIPTNKPMIRKDYPDRIYKTEREKFKAIVDEIIEKHKKGQPVLVGTISIEKSEKLSNMLKRAGIPHTVLNAKYHEKEAEIIAQAGRKGAVTIATNMAGRGTDIILGGNPDYLIKKFQHLDEKERQKKYEELKKQCEKEREEVIKLGGLHIIGTERHESRRIDNQLRGRAGRQGDPGSSRFYLSLEDDLLRIFASDKLAKIMERLGMKEGEVIEHKLVSKTIERAQKRVEAHNFEIRKHLLEYDNVLNVQRNYIYNERNYVLDNDNIRERIYEYIEDVVKDIIALYIEGKGYSEKWNINGLIDALLKKFGVYVHIDENKLHNMRYEELQEFVINEMKSAYQNKVKEVSDEIMKQIEKIVALEVIDRHWKNHLRFMDYLRDTIWTVGYKERDPLVEYRNRAFSAFQEMLGKIAEDIVELLFKVEPMIVDELTYEEEIKEEPAFVGEEIHGEFSQFSTLGIREQDVANIYRSPKKEIISKERKERKEKEREKIVSIGGVKRKSARKKKKRR